mmetsp:Transcript_33641/g.79403  ORF Transcript_33641/g.79403 Transcript_33641/m.79403 type:complete len:281 (+) Transcript_33641:175-1017(+)
MAPASAASLLIAAIFAGFCIHSTIVFAIRSGSGTYSPNPLSTTYWTLPRSCPGRKPETSVGSPAMLASAMLPGPAFDTRQSAAIIHSSMFWTKPLTTTLTLWGQAWARRKSRTCSFLPQTTAIWTSAPSVPSFSPTETAIFCNPPTPSPPPITSTVGRFSIPSCARICLLFFRRSVASQNPFRTGSPSFRICSGRSPCWSASASNSSPGTTKVSTSLLNQIAVPVARSVTTVMYGTCRLPPPSCLRMRIAEFWQRGWTETIMSGSKACKRARILSPHVQY